VFIKCDEGQNGWKFLNLTDLKPKIEQKGTVSETVEVHDVDVEHEDELHGATGHGRDAESMGVYTQPTKRSRVVDDKMDSIE